MLVEGGRPAVADLAKRFHTRRETIYRDLHVLEDVGYPIYGEDGLLSHPRLLTDHRIVSPESRLTAGEAQALLWVVQQAGGHTVSVGSLDSAANKLRALAATGPDPMMASFELDAADGSGRKINAPDEDIVVRLVQSILLNRRCRVCYHAPANPEAKMYDYDPYRLRVIGDGLYCIGQIPDVGGTTTLAVERIRSLEMLNEPFAIDPEFDGHRHASESFGVIHEKPMNVAIRFDADQAPYVRERLWHPSQKIIARADGRIELRFRAGGTFEIMRWILSWGPAAEVLRPQRLRGEVRAALREAGKRYA
jgi:proteasome accessory factor B